MTAHTSRRPLVFGAILNGVGGAGGSSELWQHPDVPINASVNVEWYIQQAQQAEAGLFDFVFTTDSSYVDATEPHHHLNRLEPLTLLSAVAARTERIGLVATVSSTYCEPWDIARRLMSLDHISGGRAAWNIVTSYKPGTARNFGRDEHGGYEQRYDRAHESVEVVLGLWDSYEDDAFATEKSAERFFDPSKLHALNHEGRFFKVAGPLNIARSLQGRPVLVQAGVSDTGRELNARFAELAFSFAGTVEWALEFNADVRARAAKYGRDPQDILFTPALGVIIADTDEEAARLHEARIDAIPYETQFGRLARQFPTLDLSGLDPEGELPDFGIPAVQASNEYVVQAGRKRGATVRQIVRDLQDNAATFHGSPARVADQIQHWYDTGAADGFIYYVGEPAQFDRFIADVVPILQERGIYRTAYDGTTLRGNLGLDIPRNRYSTPDDRRG